MYARLRDVDQQPNVMAAASSFISQEAGERLSVRQPRQHRDFAVTLEQDASHMRPQPGELPSGDGPHILLRYS
jgi:hypothetical protein